MKIITCKMEGLVGLTDDLDILENISLDCTNLAVLAQRQKNLSISPTRNTNNAKMFPYPGQNSTI